MTDANAFDWRSDESIVLRQQPCTAVYLNGRGELVIRQEDVMGDQNHMVWIAPESARLFASAILRVAGFEQPGLSESPPADGVTRKDPTAAERQRRRRAKQRCIRDSGRDAVNRHAYRPHTPTEESQLRLVAPE